MTEQPKIAVVGAGITGMAAAWKCRRAIPGAQVILFESSARTGGVLQSEWKDGYLIEKSADMFTTEPSDALQLCRELGKEQDLISTRPVNQRAYIATEDGILPVPRGLSLLLPSNPEAVAESELLSEPGRKRFLNESSIAARESDDDESLQAFVQRRFGAEFFHRIAQPLVGGIYTADPEKLSMQATLDRFRQMERTHGSLIAAAKARAKNATGNDAEQESSGARYGLFRAPRNGMGKWIDWLADDIPDVEVRLMSPVHAITKTKPVSGRARWKLQTDGDPATAASETFDGVILATPAGTSASILRTVDAKIAEELASITAASSAVVVVGIEQSALTRPFDGFGIVVPAILDREAIAISFTSNKFENRAPAGRVLIRCFIGGALQAHLLERNDEELLQTAIAEIDRVCGLRGRPEITRVFRWNDCMPQYHLGHAGRVQSIRQRVAGLAGMELAGNSYEGVGIPACLKSGIDAADRICHEIISGG